MEISEALLHVDSSDAAAVMGWQDMTLFLLAEPECEVFQKVLDKFYDGEKDQRTVRLCSLGKEVST